MFKKLVLISAVFFMTACLFASEKLILVNSTTYEGLTYTKKYLESNGIWVKHIYPPSVMIVDEKNTEGIQPVRGITGIYTGKVESSVISSLTGSAKYGVLAWNEGLEISRKAPVAPVPLPSYYFDGSDCLFAPGDTLQNYRSPAFLGKVLPEPPTSLTTGYLIGSTAICLVFPQCNGSKEATVHTWTESEITTYTNTYKNEMNKFATAEPNAHISFIYEIKTISVDWEPANYGSNDIDIEIAGINKWFPQVLTSLGVSTDYFGGPNEYSNILRASYKTDWAYMDIEISTAGSSSGGGRSFAYFGRFTFNYNHMAGAHEAVHIYYGQDEYNTGTNSALYTSGYYATPNTNYLGAGGEPNCIMITGSGTTFCTYTRQQLGWVDANANGIMDLLEVKPSGSVTLGSKILTGVAMAGTPVCASSTRGPNMTFTIKDISSVAYSVDGGDWVPATAKDGVFNSAYEPYSFYPTAEHEASTHTLDIRFMESMGLSTTISTTVGTLDLLTSVNSAVCYPTPFNPRDPGSRLKIATGAVNQSFTVAIYNTAGEKIKTLSQLGTEIDTETGFATWDGKNTAGEEVATGMYFVVATSGTKSAKGKLLVKKK
ncbi:MAG: hypothetical protein A2231_04285 [Candidatus Firestonebacteria bacterium RIFOXYA2_FULL_40_8]|nr:MAG: hypothetical protein A2231_04285 [Candidatus Firestonebacteria bacterium RIFOXYA2_FULL_40_8]